MMPHARTAALSCLVALAILLMWSAPACMGESGEYSLQTADTEVIMSFVDDTLYVGRKQTGHSTLASS